MSVSSRQFVTVTCRNVGVFVARACDRVAFRPKTSGAQKVYFQSRAPTYPSVFVQVAELI
jgi:hypothetical protein